MKMHRTVARRVASLIAVAIFATLASAQTQKGEWTLGPSGHPGKFRFTMESTNDHGHSFTSTSDWSISDFHGLDLSTLEKHDVHFTITRDAGTFEAEGFVCDGKGAGLYTFNANPQYVRDMAALGFTGITDEKQVAFALNDVSLAYAREMKGAGIHGLTADKLLACRALHIDAAFANEVRAAVVK